MVDFGWIFHRMNVQINEKERKKMVFSRKERSSMLKVRVNKEKKEEIMIFIRLHPRIRGKRQNMEGFEKCMKEEIFMFNMG